MPFIIRLLSQSFSQTLTDSLDWGTLSSRLLSQSLYPSKALGKELREREREREMDPLDGTSE